MDHVVFRAVVYNGLGPPLGLAPLRLLRRRRLILARFLRKLILVLADIPSVNLVIPILTVVPLAALGEPILVLEFVVFVFRAETGDVDLVIIHDHLVGVGILLFLALRSLLLLGLLGVQGGLFACNVGLLLLTSGFARLALGDVFGLLCGGVGL